MAESSTSTKWLVAAGALSVVLVGSLVALVLIVRSPDNGTEEVRPTSTTTTSTTLAPTSSTEAPATTTTEPEDIEVVDHELDIGGIRRTYMTIAPRTAPPSGGFPTVMVLHGLGVNAKAMSRTAPWREAVARGEFVAVFPQGVSDSWNLGPCCAPASLIGVRDDEFFDRLLAELTGRGDVDADRLYLTGFSNGALMVYALACRHSEVFAAVAPMAGVNLTGCAPSQPLSLLHQHSDADLVVPFNGGIAIGSLLTADVFPSVPVTVAAWADADGCDEPPEVVADADVERSTWSGCADGTVVELVRIPRVGHEWPRRGAYDPLEELLSFFELG